MSNIVLKFERPGCIPCNTVDDLLKQNEIKYTKVSMIDSPEMFQEFGVKSVPTVLVLNNENVEVERIIGVVEHAFINLKEKFNDGGTEV